MADKAFHTRLINMRRDLHEHPELSFQEVETTKKIRRWLEEEQIEILDVPQLKTGDCRNQRTGRRPRDSNTSGH